MIVGQSPSQEENDESEFLVNTSPAGKFIWQALRQVGIERDDCDVTAALRCIPAEPVTGSYSSYLKPRAPSKEEIKLCSTYTKGLVTLGITPRAPVTIDDPDPVEVGSGTRAILILGQLAAKQLLGGEYKKNRRIIDSAKLGVRVFLVDHPGFFLRSGIKGLNEDDERLKAFRQTVQAMAEFVNSDATVVGAEEYLRAQKYRLVKTGEKAWRFVRKLKTWAIERNERLSVDVEDDIPDDFAETGVETGERVVLTMSICPKPGYSVMFVVDHPDAIRAERDDIVKALDWLLSDPAVKLTMHYGATDAEKLNDILGIKTPGYRLDTFTSMYLANPGLFSYGLGGLTDSFAPQFSGYKHIIAPYVGPPGPWPKIASRSNETLYKFISAKSTMHFSQIPLGVLRLYNNADADIGKRFELLSKDSTPEALQAVYTDMGHILMRMERNGPLVDYRHIETLKKLWPPLVKNAAQRLRDVAEDPEFNPNTPADVAWLLWEKLAIPYPDPKAKKKSTGKEILLQVAPDYPIAGEVMAYRKVAKTMNTYIKGYEYCANLNGGRLRTKWWLVGTRTGRLSSGGSKEKIAGVVNLQNIQKKTEIRNILVSDHRWRELHLFIKAMIMTGCSDDELAESVISKFGDMDVFLEFDQGQVEVRVAAQLSGDRQMIADCEAGDIHSQVGHAMTGWAIEQIKNDKDTRTRTKNVHFGILFGLKPDGILRYIKGFDPHTKITLRDVEGYYANYFNRYPGMQVFIDKQHIFAENNGYVATVFGFKRPLIINEDLKGLVDDYGQPAYWKNIAVNSPVQGSAHQLLMCGIIALWRQPEKYAMLGIPQMEVHDNLVMRIKLKNLVECYWLAKELLEQEPLRTIKQDFPHIDWRVKLEVDGAAGFRFGVKSGLNNKLTMGAFLRDWFTENEKAITAIKVLKAAAA